jgi:hypothetical protein
MLPLAQGADRNAEQASEVGLRQVELLVPVLRLGRPLEPEIGARVLVVLNHVPADVRLGGGVKRGALPE